MAEGTTLLSHLREQADAGTEAVLGMSPEDDAAVVILQRLGFPRSRHRTQVCFAECAGAADCIQDIRYHRTCADIRYHRTCADIRYHRTCADIRYHRTCADIRYHRTCADIRYHRTCADIRYHRTCADIRYHRTCAGL